MALSNKSSYYTKLVNDAGICQKFKVANEMLDKNEERVLPAHSDAEKLAYNFNEFYVQVKKICQSIPQVNSDSTYYKPYFQGQRLDRFEPTALEELEMIIKKYEIKTYRCARIWKRKCLT